MKNVKIYLHSDKMDNIEACEQALELNWDNEKDQVILEKLKYVGYEIEMNVSVNPKNGKHQIESFVVDGKTFKAA